MKTIGELMDESGLDSYVKDGDLAHQMAVSRFAALVAASEREECAKVCEEQAEAVVDQRGAAPVKAYMCAAAIRARGQQ